MLAPCTLLLSFDVYCKCSQLQESILFYYFTKFQVQVRKVLKQTIPITKDKLKGKEKQELPKK